MSAQRLAAFQDAFAAALRGAGESTLAALTAQPGFAVYRNTLMKGCIDALAANYPCVRRLVGDEWFNAAAGCYAHTYPPHTPVLMHYGEQFECFLATFEPAAELPYLPGVAKLDRFWTEAHVASDEAMLEASVLATADEGAIGALRLRPHAAARWTWFDSTPVATIWSRNRFDETVDLGDLEWQGEGILLTRPGASVEVIALGRAGCAFLDACGAGQPVETAVACALEADSSIDLADLMACLLAAGAFTCTDSSGTLS
jgi:hypothetical protein